jgi:hypothetical protein
LDNASQTGKALLPSLWKKSMKHSHSPLHLHCCLARPHLSRVRKDLHSIPEHHQSWMTSTDLHLHQCSGRFLNHYILLVLVLPSLLAWLSSQHFLIYKNVKKIDD